ncbi:STAS domain-containing protein [Nonomuraea gerenzanensis]|uniref:Anti-sigma factor antagonist n=1 Tax=Nonomuraea gerenzanensis TaxID=93944 RepID=A0A1M4ELM5_9ACTN|nr:STAS domain-containing protein [Nonomuraea gerenzanensis]UBU11277.1 STAS domain-containing protein [Nonomuraea gerenzanensis]SBO99752.1 Anti-sigma F factor antagonist (spoIIAA-2); Anti-sigma B factor antagonist RsbV [Nonomuraea gerenzanensis]
MNLTCRHLPGATLIAVAGQVDTRNSAQLEEYIDQHRERLDEHLIIDMRELSFLDSSGLAVLLAAAMLARAHGVGVHLAGLQSMPARLLEITGTERAVTVYDHVEQAIAAVGNLDLANPAEPA